MRDHLSALDIEDEDAIHIGADGQRMAVRRPGDFTERLIEHFAAEIRLEDGSPSGQLLDFLNTKSIPEQAHVAVGTLWPRPQYYHVPVTTENISRLADISETIAEPELAVHFHVYYKGEVILQWHDAFSDPMLLSGKLEAEKVEAFAGRLKMKIKRWKNENEQITGPDGE